MRVVGARKKKLIVAFHFLKGNQAGWRCGQCRRQGLEAERRCGWLPEERRGPRKAVWARGRAVAEECPTSLVTPQSAGLVERFFVWKLTGNGSVMNYPAKAGEAILLLEKEWRETENGD